jgi:hypothetical protein
MQRGTEGGVMIDEASVREGMQVYGTDGRCFGTVGRVTDSGFSVGEHSLEFRLVDRVEGDGVYLSPVGERYFAPPTDQMAAAEELSWPAMGRDDVQAAPADVRMVSQEHVVRIPTTG